MAWTDAALNIDNWLTDRYSGTNNIHGRRRRHVEMAVRLWEEGKVEKYAFYGMLAHLHNRYRYTYATLAEWSGIPEHVVRDRVRYLNTMAKR